MAVVRCPQCQIPMTEQEAQSGSCPVCAASLAPTATVSRPTPVQAASQAPDQRGTYLLFAWLALFLLLMGGLLFTFMPGRTPRPTEPPIVAGPYPEAPPAPKQLAQANQANTEEKAPPKQNEEPSVTEPKKDPEPEKEPEAKKEPEKKEPEPKKQPEPKKEPEPKQQPKQAVKEEPREAPKVAVVPPERKVVKAPVANRRLAVLPYLADDAFKIDGDIAEFRAMQPLLLSAAELGNAPKKSIVIPKSQEAYAAYCSKGLLVAVDVIDTSGELENTEKPEKGLWSFWLNDCLEIYVDTLNHRAPDRGEVNAHQFFAFPFGTATDAGIGGYESRIFANRRESVESFVNTGPDAMLRAGQKTRTGWTMEVLIPKAVLRKFDMKPGMTLGFELQLDTGTNQFYFWANENSGRVSIYPRLWGEVVLAGIDARIELLDAAKKPLTSLRPGEPLTVRVEDADVSVDGTKKTSVTVRSANGAATMVALTETAPGVFLGTLPTRAKDAAEPREALVVQDGETLEIEYLDQVRADAARNVAVETRVKIKQ